MTVASSSVDYLHAVQFFRVPFLSQMSQFLAWITVITDILDAAIHENSESYYEPFAQPCCGIAIEHAYNIYQYITHPAVILSTIRATLTSQ